MIIYGPNVDSAHTVAEDWGSLEESILQRQDHRTLGGKLALFETGQHLQLVLPVSHVGSDAVADIQNWWLTAQEVEVQTDSGWWIQGRITNPMVPLAELEYPYEDRWQGAVMIETTIVGSYQQQAFVLDHGSWGILDADPQRLRA